MGRNKMTAEAIWAVGRTHVTKNDIEERKSTAPKVIADNIRPPDFITDEEQVKEFYEIAEELVQAKIMGNLDCDILGEYVRAKAEYSKYDMLLQNIEQKNPSSTELIRINNLPSIKELRRRREMASKKKRELGDKLGLNPIARCKIIAPKEAPPENKFNKFLEDNDNEN